jgi:hypothetical protein
MNGVLNDGVRGASWIPPEEKTVGEQVRRRITNKIQQKQPHTSHLSGHSCAIRCNAYSNHGNMFKTSASRRIDKARWKNSGSMQRA